LGGGGGGGGWTVEEEEATIGEVWMIVPLPLASVIDGRIHR
jgi:hypothetical protein